MRDFVNRMAAGTLRAIGKPLAAMSSFGDTTIPSPYAGADMYSQELASWLPNLGSGNSDYLGGRNRIVSRTRDLVRNSGWASGAVSRHLDNVIGAGFRLSAKPDYLALGQTADWAHEFAGEIESGWRMFAEDPDNYADATRHDNMNGLFGVAYRTRFVDGEAFAAALWIDNKAAGKYATTIQIIDPDRITNPYGAPDSPTLRWGIEIDDYGAPVAYNVRLAHPADWPMASKSFRWERIARETPWGRRQMLHVFDKDRADQVRGVSPLAPILERLKMIDKYDKVELQAAVLNAIFAAFIESPFDHDMLDAAMSPESPSLGKYQELRGDYHKKRGITLNGLQIPKLFPGEKFGMQAAARPAAQFNSFEEACLRNIAAGIGLSYEQLSQDWSKTNYSSARAALLEVWRGFNRSRARFAEQFATPIFALWLEEAINRGDIELPKGAPDLYAAKAAYCRVKWIGPARGWVDPTKEATAAQLRMDIGLSTLEDECAEQGKDWEEVLHQRKRELDLIDELGLPRPAWADQLVLSPIGRQQTGAPPPEGEDAGDETNSDATGKGNDGSKGNG